MPKPKQTGNLTMADVARLAGVSPITVSRALSGSTAVRKDTRDKIVEIAEKAGYRFNQAASNLRRQRSNTIAVVVEMTPTTVRPMSEPYPLALLGGIIQELSSANFTLSLSTMSTFTSAPAAVDGIILLGQGMHNDAVAGIEQLGLPLVVWGAPRPGSGHVVVGSNNREGGALAADRLAQLGRRRLVFLGDTEHAEVADRLDGFSARLQENGAHLLGMKACEFSFVAGHDAMQELLELHDNKIDGVFASNDAIAMGAIRAIAEAGLKIPRDVSVIGFDDSQSASFFVPALTTVRQHWTEGGRLLARKALAAIQGEHSESEEMPVELVVRDS
ncbi:substrate-binding domain-containing protein [Erythrobacter mangrovi]|nr:substrate-binding domain-containing protein [Erythrobacter mangrovi]